MMMLNKNRSGLLLAVVVAAFCCWTLFNGKKHINVSLIDGQTLTIVPRVHLIGGLGPSAAYVIETGDGLIAIDSGLEKDAKLFKAELARLKLDWKTLRAIFLTHAHGDHTGGAQRLSDETGAKIYAGALDVPIIEAGGPWEAVFSTFRMPNHSTHPTHVDVLVHDHDRYQFGNVTVTALETPGHTPGSTCYLAQLDGLRILFSGDVIMRLGDRPLGTYSAYLAPRYRGDAPTFLQSLTRLREIPVPDLVLPGHPVADGGQQSAQFTQEQWETLLEQGESEMRRLIQRNANGGANFLDGVPKRLLPDLYYLGDREGSAVYALVDHERLFLVDAPGGPGLDKFVATQLAEFGITPTVYAVLLTACGDRETACLAELIDHYKVHVITSQEGIERIRMRLPPETLYLSLDDLRQKEWIPVRTVQLSGRGIAPVAYSLRWAGKSILFSGEIPEFARKQSDVKFDSLAENADTKPVAYLNSIRSLADLRPDIWLPAIPTDAQNANLYGNEWETILQTNYFAISDRLRSPPGRANPKGSK